MTNKPFDEERTRRLYDEYMETHPDADLPWEDALRAARMAHEELSKHIWTDHEQIVNEVARKVASGVDFSPWTK